MHRFTSVRQTTRLFSTAKRFDAVIVGASVQNKKPTIETLDISQETRQLIEHQLSASNFKKKDDVRVLYDIKGLKQVAIVGIEQEKKNEPETARRAVRKKI